MGKSKLQRLKECPANRIIHAAVDYINRYANAPLDEIAAKLPSNNSTTLTVKKKK